MHIAGERVSIPQDVPDAVDLLHRIVGRADHARADKNAKHFFPAVIVQKDPNRFLGTQCAAADIGIFTQRTVLAVVYADIAQKDLEDARFAATG
ncbi:MAG: hypothetical protein J7K65_01145 [Planctomycetes bacterium]|nr:hypothetical protein [Planctomycetota bacterium]